jgi:solute carrier family 25 protein 42
MLMRVVPYSGTVFISFDHFQAILNAVPGLQDQQFTVRFLAGAAAGAVATTLTYPLDLLRTRFAAHWSLEPKYRGQLSALLEIASKEGVGALFAGIKPTLLGIIPYAGFSFASFETLKKTVQLTQRDPEQEISWQAKLVCGAVSGMAAQTVTYPLHTLRRRMQVYDQETLSKDGYHQSTWRALRNIWQREGLVNGLFKGLSLTWVKGPDT